MHDDLIKSDEEFVVDDNYLITLAYNYGFEGLELFELIPKEVEKEIRISYQVGMNDGHVVYDILNCIVQNVSDLNDIPIEEYEDFLKWLDALSKTGDLINLNYLEPSENEHRVFAKLYCMTIDLIMGDDFTATLH